MTISIRYLGHASFKMKINNRIIYLDPYAGDDTEYSEKADLILATHEHRDHSDPKKIALIKVEKTTLVTSKKNAANFEESKNILEPGQTYVYAGISIFGVHAYNVKRFRSPNVPYHPKNIQTAFIIEFDKNRIYFAGDTDFIEEMTELEDIDYAFLPVGGTYTMDFDDAIEAVGAFKPKNVIPIHYRESDPTDFKKLVKDKYPDINVIVLKPGEELTID